MDCVLVNLGENEMFKIGQSIIWLQTDRTDTTKQIMQSGIVTKLNKRGDEMWIDHQHKPEDCLYSSFAYPDIPEARQLLNDILEQSARHKKESLDMLTRQMQLSNQCVRDGLK
jgi:hypothetical protein